MNFIADLDRGAIRHQHPHGNLQPFSASIDDRDCAISPLGPADDLMSRTMKRMERIENPDLVAFREQGIVGADVSIPTCTVSCPVEDYRPMDNVGLVAAPDSSSRCACCRASFAASFWRVWRRHSIPESCSSSLLWSSCVSLPPQNGLLSKAVLMRGEAKNDKVNAGTLHA